MVTNLASSVTLVLKSIPASGYFLSFINYFAMSSLYALLNVDIPEHLNSYLTHLYKSINQDILALFGVDIDVVPLGDEKVT
jgi:hypothetical protein